jgi:hypothetical protein
MRKIKYLLLSFLLSLALLFGGCEVLSETVDLGEELSTQQNPGHEYDEEDSDDGTEDLPVSDEGQDDESKGESEDDASVIFGESYTSKEEVALYLHLYEELPPNFITKNKAKKLGWDSKKGNLSKVAPGMSIGGDHFGNYEGVLPKGKDYRECDIDTDGSYRGAKRIVFSDDGCIYYTEDHYETFELLYGEE